MHIYYGNTTQYLSYGISLNNCQQMMDKENVVYM